MNENQINAFLEQINYPRLNRNIVELKLVESIKTDNKHLEIVLSIHDDAMFEQTSQAIENSSLKEHFETIDVLKKQAVARKSMNYGSTATPNNRAKYAKKSDRSNFRKRGSG